MADFRPPENTYGQPPPPFDPNDTRASIDNPSLSSPHDAAADRSFSATGPDGPSNGQSAGDDEPKFSAPAGAHPATGDPNVQASVNTVLSSEIGIATLLNRLKQSIASAREFGLFLKKRASLEEDNSTGLKKICRMTQDSMRRPEHRQGTFAQAYDEMVFIHERMAENGTHFAASLHQMHDDLVELAATAERNRKNWKTNGLSAEQKVADLEQSMRKHKAKYDALADEYERARTGEARQTGKVLNAFKNKSAAQQEEDLLRKVQAADSTYHSHVQTLQQEKHQLENMVRPEAIKVLQDLIKELDSGLALQMQKFAAFNEKLLLSNGLSISPIKGPGGDANPQSRSLRHAVMSIDNEKDLSDYVTSHLSKVPATHGEIKYERNPVLNASSSPSGPPLQTSHLPGPQSQGPGTISSPFSAAGQDPRPFAPPHSRSFSASGPQQPPPPQSSGGYQPTPPAGQPASPPYGAGGPLGAPQLGALAFQGGPAPQSQQQPGGHFSPTHDRQVSGVVGAPGSTGTPPPQAPSAPVKPVFGVSLARLYERDGLAVPLVVYQCIQAVDLFGLGVEGIYRQSGSMAHIQKLKHMFDTESQSQSLDFRNPENFYHDVNSVTGLLKQFFRDLPDPLLTAEHHDSLVAAAKHDDDTVRRDSLHAIINSLPDPNYATLRALSLHLYRVMDNAHVNRMNSHNLSLILGPTLMGTSSNAISDGGWQIKVIDTILQNTYQIFDED